MTPLDELDPEWTSVEAAIWPDGPARGHGSGAYAILKAKIIAALAAPPPPTLDVARLAEAWNNVMMFDGAGTYVRLAYWHDVAAEYTRLTQAAVMASTDGVHNAPDTAE